MLSFISTDFLHYFAAFFLLYVSNSKLSFWVLLFKNITVTDQTKNPKANLLFGGGGNFKTFSSSKSLKSDSSEFSSLSPLETISSSLYPFHFGVRVFLGPKPTLYLRVGPPRVDEVSEPLREGGAPAEARGCLFFEPGGRPRFPISLNKTDSYFNLLLTTN